jgi:hypothetical protein
VSEPAAQPPQVRVLEACDIVVDGVLDEPCWASTPPVDQFLRYRPNQGGPPVGTTEVRFLQDERYLYVSARITGVDYPIRARISPREDINSDDQIGVYLDTYHDGRSGYVFYHNPLGIQQDARVNGNTWVVSWDTSFRSRGTVDADGRGYSLEIAFPWRSLKYDDGDDARTWGLILTRKIPSEGYKYGFPALENGHPAWWTQAAELVGVQPPSRGSGLELIPSLTVGRAWSTEEGPVDFGQLGGVPILQVVRPSLDARYGLSPDLGLATTINPDFSQVEADTADVRLNARFAFQFPERRPFFLDGVDAYGDPRNTLYTRSIADPLYGLKVTGRERGTSVGVVHALDRSPLGSFHEDGAPGMDAGGWASDTYARFRFDAFEAGQVGLVLADKRLVTSPEGAPVEGQPTYDGFGADATIPLGGRWVVAGNAQESAVSTTTEGLYGGAGRASIERTSGVGTGFTAAVGGTTEGFRQELGFLNYSGFGDASLYLDHTFTDVGPFDTFVPSVAASTLRETDDEHTDTLSAAQDVVAGPTFAWVYGTGGRRRFQGTDAVQWAGGGGAGSQLGRTVEFEASVDLGRALDFGTLTLASDQAAGLELALRPTTSIRVDLSASEARHTPDDADGAPLATERASFQRTRFTWQFTRALGTRWIVQHDRLALLDDRRDGLLISGLLTLLERPGTAFYAGWNERLDLQVGETTERAVFAKVSVLVRP